MKNILLAILLITTVVFGSLYVQEARKASQAEQSVIELQRQAADRQTALDQQEKQVAGLRLRLAAARAQMESKASEAEQLQQALTNSVQAAPETNSKPSNPLTEMFKDPKMKEMIKTQQKAAMGGIIDKNYAQFIADMHLSPEQTASLKDLITQKMMAGTDLGMSMLSDDMDAAKRKELTDQLKASTDAIDDQIKQLLGDNGYSQFQTYEKTQGERTAVTGLADQLASGPMALNADQQQQLVQAMTQQRQAFKFTTDLSDRSQFTGDYATMFSEDNVNQYFQQLDQLNQKYMDSARAILSPDQLDAFQKYLNNQQQLQKMGMQMAAKMFGAKAAGK
jgi:hypothetical protein